MTDDLALTLRDFVSKLEALGLPYMIVGSFAALAHGRTRATQDLDFVVDLDLGSVRRLVSVLPPDRFYVSEDAARDAIDRESMFNVIDVKTGWKIDIVPRKHRAFSQSEFDRRARLDVLGLDAWVASIEDTILSKLEWSKAGGGSERQREDVRELLRLAGPRLDRPYVDAWVAKLQLEDEWLVVHNSPD